jgi:hypothetical protein
MLSAGTKAVMMLAAFAIFFALVCPIAPTPMAVQKHGSSHVSTTPIAINAAIVVALCTALMQPVEYVPAYVSASASDLNCVRNC